MGKIELALVIACGYVLGQIVWEIVGLLIEWAGKLVGWMIATGLKRIAARRQAEVAAAEAAALNGRSPLVKETGGEIR